MHSFLEVEFDSIFGVLILFSCGCFGWVLTKHMLELCALLALSRKTKSLDIAIGKPKGRGSTFVKSSQQTSALQREPPFSVVEGPATLGSPALPAIAAVDFFISAYEMFSPRSTPCREVVERWAPADDYIVRTPVLDNLEALQINDEVDSVSSFPSIVESDTSYCDSESSSLDMSGSELDDDRIESPVMLLEALISGYEMFEANTVPYPKRVSAQVEGSLSADADGGVSSDDAAWMQLDELISAYEMFTFDEMRSTSPRPNVAEDKKCSSEQTRGTTMSSSTVRTSEALSDIDESPFGLSKLGSVGSEDDYDDGYATDTSSNLPDTLFGNPVEVL